LLDYLLHYRDDIVDYARGRLGLVHGVNHLLRLHRLELCEEKRSYYWIDPPTQIVGVYPHRVLAYRLAAAIHGMMQPRITGHLHRDCVLRGLRHLTGDET